MAVSICLPNTTLTSEPIVIKLSSATNFDLSAESVAVKEVSVDLLPSVTPPMAAVEVTFTHLPSAVEVVKVVTLAEALGHQIPLTLHSVVEGGKLYAEISLSVPMGEETLKVDCVFGKKSETAINGVVAGKTAPVAVFNATGARQNGLQKGLNIVRTADGKTVKVLK